MAAWGDDELHAVSEYYFAELDEPTRASSAQISLLNRELDRLSKDGDIVIISQEAPTLAYADVLTRGAVNASAERVRPGVPHFLPPLKAGVPLDRLTLAEWTVSPSNPLTPRVTVNRMWSEIFGTGLVETTEDFGIMGSRPSHPELLDWLAAEFRASGWNVKHMSKLMVISATYLQSAKSTSERLMKDSKNLLLAHLTRFRMCS